MGKNVQTDFDLALNHIKTGKSYVSTSSEDKLKFYALFKQVKSGDNDTAEPSRFNVVAHAKWKAWKSYAGKSKEEAMELYVQHLQHVDPSFKLPKSPPAPTITVEKEKSTSASVSKQVDPSIEDKEPDSEGPSSFLMSLLGCLTVIGFGISGFLYTTLSHQALLFLGIFVSGIVGVFGVFAFQLDQHGLIALFPPLLKRILLERTLLEVIKKGEILRYYKEQWEEILPLLLSRTDQERNEALKNMDIENRKYFTTHGVINNFPEWQKKLILSRDQYDALTARGPRYNPPLPEAPVAVVSVTNSTSRNVVNQPKLQQRNLDAQRQLASRLFQNLLKRQNVRLVLRFVNPKACKAGAIGLMLSLIIQLRISAQSRSTALNVIRVLTILGSGLGAGVAVLLAFLHRNARRYDYLEQSGNLDVR
mmetsp:Transcript_12934/g.16788  ORF Transcript_12934/g.16788 Transcript_12934/m.16788 type:complete len:420 (+) Transcript_12934:107-1366(+)